MILPERFTQTEGGTLRGAVPALLGYLLAFALISAILFLSMDRTFGVYDDAMVMTAALRMLHGQVIHRDFYYAYGPAGPAVLAGAFRLFGLSLLTARLLDIGFESLLLLSVFALLRTFCRTAIAVGASVLCLCWYVMVDMADSVFTPCSLLTLLSTALLLEAAFAVRLGGPNSCWRVFWAASISSSATTLGLRLQDVRSS